MKAPFLAWALCCAACLLAGCSGKMYTLEVEANTFPALAQTEGALESYRIVTPNRELQAGSLRHQEAEEHVRTALSGKGYYEAVEGEVADMAILYDYGVGPPKEVFREFTMPIYEMRPVTIFVSKTVIGSNGQPTTVSIPRTVMRQVEVGEETHVKAETVYEKYMTIHARRNSPEKEGARRAADLWTVTVHNESESDDLREHLPVLAAAAIDYIGSDFEESQEVELEAKDDAISFVKRGYSKVQQ